ncbi:MAG: mannitol dehydrogenase [Clostridia bacterium]|nr:mannitol dehydrogenase [Clostridia bacterium]
MKKQAVMYGGGNIGRGFIGTLFCASGYETAFIDVAQPVLDALNRDHSYPVRIVRSDGHTDIKVTDVRGVNGNDKDLSAEVIANADIMATAVGVKILKFIVPNIVAGIKLRMKNGKGPLNIIICENLMDANKVLEGMLKEQLAQDEIKWFDENVGLVEASIGRMVPVQTDEMKDGDPMRVCVESYGFLPVDKAAFKGGIPEIKGMIPFEPFDFYIKRKLYVHNMGHATCAYLGDLLGIEYIWQSIDVSDVYAIVREAMQESALALSKKYGVELEKIMLHISDLLFRFTNRALMDTTKRVGGDPARKLSPADRLIGSSTLDLEQGVYPAFTAVGAAAGLKRLIDETEGAVQTEDCAAKTLTEVSGLNKESELSKLILGYYRMINSGASVADLKRRAAIIAAEHRDSIV